MQYTVYAKTVVTYSKVFDAESEAEAAQSAENDDGDGWDLQDESGFDIVDIEPA